MTDPKRVRVQCEKHPKQPIGCFVFDAGGQWTFQLSAAFWAKSKKPVEGTLFVPDEGAEWPEVITLVDPVSGRRRTKSALDQIDRVEGQDGATYVRQVAPEVTTRLERRTWSLYCSRCAEAGKAAPVVFHEDSIPKIADKLLHYADSSKTTFVTLSVLQYALSSTQ